MEPCWWSQTAIAKLQRIIMDASKYALRMTQSVFLKKKTPDQKSMSKDLVSISLTLTPPHGALMCDS